MSAAQNWLPAALSSLETPVLIPVRQVDGDKEGYINEHGEVVIGFEFDRASDFHDGLAQVWLNRQCGYIDIRGKAVIPYRSCNRFGDFQEGFAAVRFKDRKYPKYYLMDAQGRVIQGVSFFSISRFSEGLAAVDSGKRGWGYIGKDGQFVIPPKFEDYAGSFSEEVAYARFDGKVGFIDKHGAFVIAPRFEEAKDFSEGLAPVRLDGKWGFINHQGAFVIEPQFPYVYCFSEGLAVAWAEKAKFPYDGTPPYEDKVGYIDHQGHWAIAPMYKTADPFDHGRAAVSKGLLGLVDSGGKEVVPLVNLETFSRGHGLWYVKKENELHTFPESQIIDAQGNAYTGMTIAAPGVCASTRRFRVWIRFQ